MRPAEELRYLIMAAQREGNRLFSQALKQLGVTSSQAEVIRLLQDRQPLTLNGLGELLICESGNSPSRLVDRLVSAGLVNRQSAIHDRRHIELSLAPNGTQLTRQIADLEDDLYRAIDTAAQAYDFDQLTGFLRAYVADLPAGQALTRRTQ